MQKTVCSLFLLAGACSGVSDGDALAQPQDLTGAGVYVSDLVATYQANGWGTYERDRSNGEQGANDGHTLSLRGATYAKGLGVHAASEVRFALGGAYARFAADVGLDDEVTGGAVEFRVLLDGTQVYASGTLTSASAAIPVDLDVSGKNEIALVVVSENGASNQFDHADWANARLTVGATYVSDLVPTSAQNGWGPYEKDHSNGETAVGDGRTLTLHGVTYAKGLGVHAASELHYALGGNYARFLTDVGLDDEVKHGTNNWPGGVEFRVTLDGKQIYTSGQVLATTPTAHLSLDVSGGSELVLTVAPSPDVNFAHADWADARLVAMSAAPAPTTPAQENCATKLQALIDSATSGATVTAPACIYRESVTLNKSITLIAAAGAEVRGSDVWTNWNGNTSANSVPAFSVNGNCQDASGNEFAGAAADAYPCHWPEQVFVDGAALTQIRQGSAPQHGQFVLDGSRHVVLGDSPAGHIVEVTTRTHWLTITAANATVDGFRMRHAATLAQDGALQVHANSATVKNAILSDAHGTNLTVDNVSGVKILGCDLARGGQMGAHFSQANGLLMQSCRIHDNNTELFSREWEAGGLKMAVTSNAVFDGNESDHNNGPGLWCDVSCDNIEYKNNRLHHNAWAGIMYEISTDAKIHDNYAWENGYGKNAWGWGAGILVSSSGSNSSDGLQVYNNVCAFNASGGISVIWQPGRSDDQTPQNIHVYDNATVGAVQFLADGGQSINPNGNNNTSYGNTTASTATLTQFMMPTSAESH